MNVLAKILFKSSLLARLAARRNSSLFDREEKSISSIEKLRQSTWLHVFVIVLNFVDHLTNWQSHEV